MAGSYIHIVKDSRKRNLSNDFLCNKMRANIILLIKQYFSPIIIFFTFYYNKYQLIKKV